VTLVKIWFVREGPEPTRGGPPCELPLQTWIETRESEPPGESGELTIKINESAAENDWIEVRPSESDG